MNRRRFCVTLVVACLVAFAASGETRTLVILHTNDLHDHIRPGYDKVGGMPYVSGYVKSVRAQRNDVLLLDAGDVTEKGDMVAFETHGAIMYEAMAKIGYAATTIGNHDAKAGLEALRAWQTAASGVTFLAVNYSDPQGKPCFEPSKVFEVNGIRVGVIGVALPKDTEERDPEVWTQAVAQEAERLKEKADLLVVLGHLDSKSCRDLSLRVPAIRVLVGGHSHELITKPIIVEKTGALIVQAGCYAHYVGRVDLTVDLDTKQIAHADGSVVEMRHDTVPCDNALLEWVRQREREVCPEAGRVVAHCEKPVDSIGVGRLAADALRKRAGADIGFCHPGQIIRSGLPAGAIDVNALFVTGGQRGVKIVTAAVTGEAIEKYLKAVKTGAKGDTQWAGFKAELEYASANGGWVVHTDLDPELRYRVVMPEVEWQTRFARRSDKGDKSSNAPRPKACPFSFIDALTAYVEDLDKENVTLDAHVKKLAAAQALKPVPATR